MNTDELGTTDRFVVVVNDEEQHSLWPAYRSIPAGWRDVGYAGSRQDCLAYIEKHWTDITPLSVRKSLADAR